MFPGAMNYLSTTNSQQYQFSWKKP